MATQEETIEAFLKCFRISLNFILLYSKDHKSFLKSIADLKEKVEALFVYLNPIAINFTAEAISLNGVAYSKMSLHRELAALFHQRKIQSLTINRGITREELVVLMDKLALAPKDIIKAGGMALIISASLKNPHFLVADLDYSQLLRGEGEEVKDIWLFMLRNAVAKEDLKKIAEFADNFEIMLQKFKTRDLVEDDELNKDLQKFLAYLKKVDPERFLRSSKVILKMILKDKSVLMDAEKAQKLKVFLSELTPEDYSQVLWNEIVSDPNFDVTSFQMFSKLLSEEEHKKVAVLLSSNLSEHKTKNIPANVARKIRELFSSPSSESSVSAMYRRAIAGSGRSFIFDEEFIFDRKQMVENYRYILLNLLLEENNGKQLELIISKLLKEWDKVAKEKNVEYLKCLGQVLREKKSPKPDIPLFLDLRGKFYDYIESFIWEDNFPSGFAGLLETMEASSSGADVYLEKIFDQGRINSLSLKMFFRFFPRKLPDFYSRLEEKRDDLDMVSKIVESLKEIDFSLSLPVLEDIYSFSSEIIKIEILKSMAKSGTFNREFIFGVLRSDRDFIRKEALAVLSQPQDYQKGLEILLLLPNPWGKNNGLLTENLWIMEELKCKPAVKYLERLYHNTAFWNLKLKKRIRQVLGRLNV